MLKKRLENLKTCQLKPPKMKHKEKEFKIIGRDLVSYRVASNGLKK